MATDTPDDWQSSEFSIHEVLYMGSVSLTYKVEHLIGDANGDPFEILARMEELRGKPIVFT